MQHGLTGSQHFKILDKFMDKVLASFYKKMKVASDENKVVDLRGEIIGIFESVMTMYLLERDISGDMIEAKVIEADGSIKSKTLPFFEALNNSLAVGASQSASKYVFGRLNVTAIMRAASFNWLKLSSAIDDIVVKQMEIFAS